jgi:hypothetical protein
LSAGGMSLFCEQEVTSGTVIKVTVAPPGQEELTIEGAVSWVRKENKVFGVSFGQLNKKRERLQEWIDAYLDAQLNSDNARSARSGD